MNSPPPLPQHNLQAQASYPIFMNNHDDNDKSMGKAGNMSGFGVVTATTYDSRQPVILRNTSTNLQNN
jgi:hypothetical protein